MIKLIVLDLDGTLLPYGACAVSSPVKALIRTALDKKITVAISSGRTYQELISYLPEFADTLWFICCDGAYYLKGGRVYYERRIESSDLAHFNGSTAVLHSAFESYALGDLPQEAAHFNATPVARLTDVKEKIFKVTAYGTNVKLPPYSGLRTHWDGGANASAQFVNRFCDKGTALSDLQTRLMLTKFDTACIGDSGNDIAMMRNAKRSFCVGTRSPELAAVCTDQTPTAEQALKILIE